MKRKAAILFISSFLLFAGCKKEEEPLLSKEEQTIVWHKPQARGFGHFNYLDINEREAQKLMKDKFTVEIPQLYKSAIPVLKRLLQTQENIKEEPVYSVTATGNNLVINGTYAYKNKLDQNYYSYATVKISYEYNAEKKLIALSSQEITVFNYYETGVVYLNEPVKAFEELANLTKISNLKEKMRIFNETINKPAEELIDKQVALENSLKQAKEDNRIARNLGMDFGANGTLRTIHIVMKDYTL